MTASQLGAPARSAGRGVFLPGRERQLAYLVATASTLRERGVSFYVLEAGAGMGKTSLIDAALARLAVTDLRRIWVPSELDQEPYRTVTRLIDGAIGAAESSLTEQAMGEQAMGEPALGGPAPGELTVQRALHERSRRYGELAERILASCDEQPTTVVFDDFQWIDAASSAFVDFLVDELTTHPHVPLLVVVAHRPVSETAHCDVLLKRLRQLRRATVERLEPLDGADLFEAIEQLGYMRPSPTLQAMVQRASLGNPLLVRAALETLRRRGVPADLSADDRRAQGTLDIQAPHDDPVRQWVDNLEPAVQRILGGAALVGGELTAREAVAVTGLDTGSVETALDAGHALGLVETDGMLYWFVHALVRDELIHRVPVSQRSRIHRRCVDVARERAGNDATAWARAAEHVLLSGTHADPLDAHHFEVLEAASRWASDVGAWSAAARYAEAALDLAPGVNIDPSRVLQLELHAAEAHSFNNDIAATRRRLERVLALPAAEADESVRGKALRLSARAAMMASAQMGQRGIDLAPLAAFAAEASDPAERANALQLLAECELGQARVDEAMTHALDAARAAERSGDRRAVAMAHAALGFAHFVAIDMASADAAYRRTHDIAIEIRDAWMESESLARLPLVSLVAGDLDESERQADIACEVAIRNRQYVSESIAECARAVIALLRGDLGAVERHSHRARSTMHRSGYLASLALFYPALLRARLLSGDVDGAEQALREWTADGGHVAPPPSRYAQLLALEGGSGPPPAHASRRRGGRLTQGGISLTALQVELELRASKPAPDAVLRPMLELLEAAMQRGLVVPSNWPVCLPRLVGDAYRRLGDTSAAVEHYRTAAVLCTYARAHTEAMPALVSLALIEDPDVPDDERRQAASQAHRLATRLGFTDVATTAALAMHRAIELDASEGDADYLVVLVSDIVGSTPLSVDAGDRAYHDTIVLHHRVVRAALREHKGAEFSEGGDSLFASFTNAADAVACAVSIQARLAAARQAGSVCHARIGLAAGAPFVHDGRPYGAVVNLAARIVATAGPDEIVVTEAIASADRAGTSFTPRAAIALKGFPGVHTPFVLALSEP